MSMISYAQNFEDVMLSRALAQVENGFYIDVGAQHPVIDSVSKAFYDKGWRGVHVEATPAYAALLKESRPDEQVMQVAVNDKSGNITFYEIPETGISTGDKVIAQSHRARGFDVREITVPCVTLTAVFNLAKQAKAREIHWLKIDVEGMELQVLRSWGKHKARPWVVVVESTLPLTQTENHQTWESCLLDRGYTHVYFDGLNRYYLASSHSELAAAFKSGPNVFDDFMLDGGASAPFCAKVNEKYRQAEHALQTQVAQTQRQIDAIAKVDAALTNVSQQLQTAKEEAARYVALEVTLATEISALQGQVQQAKDESAQRDQALQAQSVEAIRQAQEQAQAHQSTLQQREQALASQLADLRAQMHLADQAAALREQALKQLASETYRQAQEQSQVHLNALARHEQTSEKQLDALQAQLLQARADAAQREQALQAQSASAVQHAKDEAKTHLNTLAERENAFAQQLRDLQAQMRQAAEQADQHEQALRTQFADTLHQAQDKADTHLKTLLAREQVFSSQILELQAQTRQAREQADQRELALRDQSAAALQDTQRKAQEYLETLVQREQAFSEQLQALQAQMREANHGASQRELALRELASETFRQAQTHAQAHLHALVQREQVFGKEIRDLCLEMANAQSEAAQRERDLRDDAVRDQQKAHEQILRRSEDWAQREKALEKEISNLHVEAQTLHHAQQLQKQEHEHQISARHDDKTRLIEKFVALEAQLQSEITRERQTSLLIRESLSALQQNLDKTHASLAWRISAPFRLLAGLMSPQKTPEIAPAEALLPSPLPHSPPPSSTSAHSAFATSLSRLSNTESPQPNPIQHAAVAPHQPAEAGAVNPLMSVAQAANTNPGPTVEFSPTSSTSPTTHSQPAPVVQAMNTPLLAIHPSTPIMASSLDELMACHDQHFMSSAYQTILGRAPDPEGLGYSLGRLRQGISKIQVLAQLKLSKEGKASTVNLPGLDRAIRRYQQQRYPLIGWIFKRIHGAESNNPIERKLRAIENKLNVLSDESNRRFDQMEVGLSGLHVLVSQQTQSLVAWPKNQYMANVPPEHIEPQQSEGIRQLSLRAREIYSRLKIAATVQMRGNAQ